MPMSPTWRSASFSPTPIPISCWSTRSAAPASSSRPRRERPSGRGIASAPWTAPDAAPMPTSTGPPSASRSERNAAPPPGWRPESATNPGGALGCARADGVPLRASRHDTPLGGLPAHPHRSRHRGPRRQSGQTRPRPRHRGADRRHPRQHHHRRRQDEHQHVGTIVGAKGLPCSARECSWPRSNANAKRAAEYWLGRRHPIHRAEPALPMRGAGAQNAGPSAPMTARTAGCTVTVTSSPPP